ncbi:MAG: PEGA domain-containing protein [Candidatus Poribacteria bacterium]|nr:PEGA domain-containing protein [Candidatus Poribacteria bacterium]MDE0502938.1 PEGA domain-containing protein [Candidatus Poribacteria bacterium]
MMKRQLLLVVIISGYLSVSILPAFAQPTDSSVHWLLADTNPDARSRADFEAFVRLLDTRGSVPSNRIQHIDAEQCTKVGIHEAIRNLAAPMHHEDRFIFYYRGGVTKPPRTNSIYLLPHGSGTANLAEAVQDTQLNRWFREAGVKDVMVLFDSYTDDRNIYAYLANRELLGTSALVSIRSTGKGEDSLLRKVVSALETDASDLDDNRKITIGELHEHLVTTAPPRESIVVPTGDVETPVLKLTPMLKITSVPPGASVFLNGKNIGSSPHRVIDNLKREDYTIQVKKQGYFVPPTRSAETTMSQGETVEVSWELKPIPVFGRITHPEGKVIEQITAWIEDTTYHQIVNLDGTFRFEDLNTGESLEVGKSYTLKAEAEEIYSAETTFTFEGHDAIERNLALAEKTWFQLAEERFDQKDDEGAIAAFQNAIETTTEIPPLSPELTVLLFNSFSAAVDSMDIENIAYFVATAKLADRFGNKETAKTYWEMVKTEASKGTAEHKLATKRLRQLNLRHYIINSVLVVLLVVVLISGGYTARKYYRGRANRS